MSLLATSLLSTTFAPLIAAATIPEGIEREAAALLASLGIEHEPGEAVAVLHRRLEPLQGRDDLVALLELSEALHADLTAFIGAPEESAVPSETLMRELKRRPQQVRAVLMSLSVTGAIRATAVAAQQEAAPGPLDYQPRRRAEALVASQPQVLEAVGRLFQMAAARAGVQVVEVPPALSLDYVLLQPGEFQGGPLEIVLADVDDTTRRGQMYLEWVIKDVLRYGPKSSVGVRLWRVLWYGVVKGLKLRRQEKEQGHADEEQTRAVVAQALKGLDQGLVRKSLDRFYDAFGKRHIVPYMREEFDFHRRNGRLILLLSASPEYLVRKHAEDTGIPPENAFGTRVSVDSEGEVSFTLLRSDEKVALIKREVFARLEAAGVSYKITHAYSDSDSDLAMLTLAREQGGVVVSTNAPREAFEHRVLREMHGMAMREEGDTRERTLFDDEEAGAFVHRERIAPIPTYWQADLQAYLKVAGQSAASFAVAAGLVTFAASAMAHGLTGVEWADVIANGGLGAVGGGAGSAVGHLFTPKSGEVSGRRRWLLGYSAPLVSATILAGMYPGILQTLTNLPAVAAAGAVALAAAGATQNIAGGLRWLARGLGWRSVDKAARGITGETMMRTTEVAAYTGLASLLSLLG